MSFKTDKKDGVKEEIVKIVTSLEPEVEVLDEGKKKEDTQRNGFDIIRLILGLVIFLIGMYGNFGDLVCNICTVVSLIILLSRTAVKGFKQVTKNKVLDENTLIVVSSIGAYLVGKGMEGVMVITLYEIGKILEARAVSKTRKSISSLMDIKPEYANIKINDDVKKVLPDEVKIGDIIVVKAGEKIPLDGKVISGAAELDNSALTGESKLVKVKKDDKVLSGSINAQGLIEIEVEEVYENSTVNQILNMVENATDKKAKTENFVAKAAKGSCPSRNHSSRSSRPISAGSARTASPTPCCFTRLCWTIGCSRPRPSNGHSAWPAKRSDAPTSPSTRCAPRTPPCSSSRAGPCARRWTTSDTPASPSRWTATNGSSENTTATPWNSSPTGTCHRTIRP